MFTPLGPQDPREISGYRLIARIGEGGMGTVYLSHTRGGQAVALKLIRREFGDDPEFRRRFDQEVQAARRVQGYHLVPVVDHDTSGPLPWLASAFVPGLALQAVLEAHGPLPLSAVFRLVGCTAQALGSIHAAGVVHRDLKPGNILLGATGPYVIDFGIARAGDATQLTGSGVIGTPQYMSPEHALGERVGPATDVFSLGLIAAVAATGRHPYGAGGALTVATQIANTASRPPRLDEYPAELRPLLERCLTADPGTRITPAELASLCEQAAGRPLRESGDWLPAPVAARIAHHEQAAQLPPQPADPASPAYPPNAPNAPQPGSNPYATGATPHPNPYATGTVPPAASVPSYGPGQAGPGTGTGPAAGGGWPGTAPLTQPPGAVPPAQGPGSGPFPASQPAPQPPETGSAAPRRKRPALLIAAVVVAFATGIGGTLWALGKDSDDEKKQNNGSSAQGPRKSGTDGGSATPDDSSDDSTSGSTGEPSGTGSENLPPASYTEIFKDKPLTLRTPSGLDNTYVDMDVPLVDPNAGIDSDDRELNASYDTLEFNRALGKANGESAEACHTAAKQNPLPSSVSGETLNKEKTIVAGDVMCSVTSEGNLAQWKISNVVFDANKRTPTYEGTLTLWKID
ncbi:serine/threonine-protein kinase [Streptomyces sp. ML-6]|uniref:serine/threonine protein kinase n=1 Tax=Streptomyces sp. ML-6 TaxID=2982693 RepID=UPI0024C08B03|nr:serine/threonine-protein kinase [Streptomyces sp. ML-6]MDK0519798.1 protein kinase [Streptomyces sp. ML-6]